jgi:hypothetical protein
MREPALPLAHVHCAVVNGVLIYNIYACAVADSTYIYSVFIIVTRALSWLVTYVVASRIIAYKARRFSSRLY